MASPYSEKDQIISHYDQLANCYHELYDHQIEYFAEIIMKWLNIKADDRIADIGGGTGCVAKIIHQKCGLLENILVVDPSPESIKVAQQKEGLSVMLADADLFLASPQAQRYNKYILCCSVHHIPDQETTFKMAYQCLPVGGQIVIVQHPSQKFPFPVWKEMKSHLSTASTVDSNVQFLKEAGFTATSVEEARIYPLNKDVYYEKLRSRIYSTLQFFTDDAIEAGIKELNETVFKESDSIDIHEIMSVIHAIK